MGNDIDLRDNAGLADIAPTLLQLLGLPIPKEMTGKSLIKEVESKGYNKLFNMFKNPHQKLSWI